MEGAATRAIRLTIRQRGDELEVVSGQPVKMRVPASDPTYGFAEHAGFWFEVRSEDQECLYRRIIPNPLTAEVEAPSGDPERPFTRAKAPSGEVVFVLLVPEFESGREVVLCGSPKGAPTGRARPIAAIDLRKPTGRVRLLATSDEEKAPRPSRKRPKRGDRRGKGKK